MNASTGRIVALVAAVAVLAGCGPDQMPVGPDASPPSHPSTTATLIPRPRPATTATTTTTSTTTAGAVPMPDPKLTPGAVATTDLNVVCHTSTDDRRNVTAAARAKVFAAYGITGSHDGYELDHLIPLELGGSNDAANLWPEPAPGYRQKDKLEDHLHALVCAVPPKLALTTAQHAIATDWQAAAATYP